MLKFTIIILICLFLAVTTTFLPQYITNSNDLSNVSYGLPLRFVSQDFSDYSDQLPATIYFSDKRNNDNFSTINPVNFWIDAGIIFLVIQGVLLIFNKIFDKKD